MITVDFPTFRTMCGTLEALSNSLNEKKKRFKGINFYCPVDTSMSLDVMLPAFLH